MPRTAPLTPAGCPPVHGLPRPRGPCTNLITEARGIPLAVSLTGKNRDDVTQLIPLTEAVPPLRGRRGRPRRRPDTIYADRGYDHDKYRKQVRADPISFPSGS